MYNFTHPHALFLSVVDSMGKPGSGILDGNVEWLGSFEQCKAATEVKRANISFNTQYCLAPMVSQDNFKKNFFTTVPE